MNTRGSSATCRPQRRRRLRAVPTAQRAATHTASAGFALASAFAPLGAAAAVPLPTPSDASLGAAAASPPTDAGVPLFLVLLACSASLTALLSARFTMSWFPRVERLRHEAPYVYLKRSTDWVLAPLRAVLDTRDTAALGRRITTVDRRPEWAGGVDASPVAALCILRSAVSAAVVRLHSRLCS